MKAKLVVVGGDVKATEINLKLPAIIGRGREATLTLPHPLVSRRHCELYEVDGQLMVRDLGSLNGTYVGTQRIVESPLPSGELLTVATVNFRAVYAHADVENGTELPDLVGNDDSTHGRSSAKRKSSSEARDDTVDAPVSRARATRLDGPIERDTEWQVGNVPPRSDSSDGDDLSSLLNDLR